MAVALAVSTLDPHQRQKIETWMAQSEHEGEAWTDELTQTALQSQDEIEQMEKDLDEYRERMASDKVKEEIEQRLLKRLENNIETMWKK